MVGKRGKPGGSKQVPCKESHTIKRGQSARCDSQRDNACQRNGRCRRPCRRSHHVLPACVAGWQVQEFACGPPGDDRFEANRGAPGQNDRIRCRDPIEPERGEIVAHQFRTELDQSGGEARLPRPGGPGDQYGAPVNRHGTGVHREKPPPRQKMCNDGPIKGVRQRATPSLSRKKLDPAAIDHVEDRLIAPRKARAIGEQGSRTHRHDEFAWRERGHAPDRYIGGLPRARLGKLNQRDITVPNQAVSKAAPMRFRLHVRAAVSPFRPESGPPPRNMYPR